MPPRWRGTWAVIDVASSGNTSNASHAGTYAALFSDQPARCGGGQSPRANRPNRWKILDFGLYDTIFHVLPRRPDPDGWMLGRQDVEEIRLAMKMRQYTGCPLWPP